MWNTAYNSKHVNLLAPYDHTFLLSGCSKAVGKMIIDHADGLHEGVADSGANESEALPLQITGHGFRFRRLGRHIFEGDHAGSSKCFVAGELPDVPVEAAVFLLDL